MKAVGMTRQDVLDGKSGHVVIPAPKPKRHVLPLKVVRTAR